MRVLNLKCGYFQAPTDFQRSWGPIRLLLFLGHLFEWGVVRCGLFRAALHLDHANSLCKRLEILTCDWPKGSNRSQPLDT